MPSLQELERAAVEVLTILRSIKEFEDASIAVFGGLALWKYIPAGRTTEDVDFIISVREAPKAVKQKLLQLHASNFVEHAQFFYHKNASDQHIQIDIVPSWQSLYMPSTAVKLKDLPANKIPYISVSDLIVLKIYSCGMRAQPAKRRTDAADAEALLSYAATGLPLSLTDWQKSQVENCLEDVVKHGRQDEKWWRERLGLPASK